MVVTPKLRDGQSFVQGRSSAKAQELIALAEKHDLVGDIVTTSFGYIVPASILEGDAPEAATGDTDAPETGDTDATEADAPETDATEVEAGGDGAEFDPSESNIDEVKAYLATADDAERERVLAAEEAGKARKGILAESTEGDK